jgi:hypothetical protein
MSKLALCIAILIAGCSREHDRSSPASSPPPAAKAPLRGAAADADLRVMLAEVASAKACEMIRGKFRGLRAADRPELVTGVLWIQDCKITNDGTRVVFRLRGAGWQWAAQSQKKVGGKFSLRQYVRFNADVTMPGALDIAYDRATHIASIWFTPSTTPQVEFKPVGDFDVDRQGVWSSVVGAAGSVFAHSPETLARKDAKKQGTQQFESTLADGVAVTINLCTGLMRFNLGRRDKGEMQRPDVGETKRVPIELHPGGIAIAGPQLARHGLTIHAETTEGRVRIALACADQAERVAAAFMADKPPPRASLLGQVDVRGRAKLTIKPVACPVIAIASPLDARQATVSWLRMPSEIAREMGGPVVQCP